MFAIRVAVDNCAKRRASFNPFARCKNRSHDSMDAKLLAKFERP